jgi:hypothetical protein
MEGTYSLGVLYSKNPVLWIGIADFSCVLVILDAGRSWKEIVRIAESTNIVHRRRIQDGTTSKRRYARIYDLSSYETSWSACIRLQIKCNVICGEVAPSVALKDAVPQLQ